MFPLVVLLSLSEWHSDVAEFVVKAQFREPRIMASIVRGE